MTMQLAPWRVNPNPVIVPGQLHGELDSHKAGACHVIEHDGRYLMVYWGTNAAGEHHVLAAQAPLDSPNDWKPLGPLIGRQPDQAHNCRGPGFPFLLPIDQKRWHLYFCGWGDPASRSLPNTTGVAISEDGGKSWRYHDRNPIIELDQPYDRHGTGSCWVIREGDLFRMWYTAIGSTFALPEGVGSGHGKTPPEIGIAYAESNDGITWRKPVGDLVVRPRHAGVDPYEYIVSKPAVVVDRTGQGSRYTLWVNTFGTAYRVHRLTSSDGIQWTWSPRVGPDGELGVGGVGAYDDHQRSYPVMVQHSSELRCWFTGNGFGNKGMGYATGL